MRFPVTLTITPSRRLRAALLLVHFAAILALAASSLSRQLLGGGILLVALSAVAVLRPCAPLTLRLGDDGTLSGLDAMGAEEKLRLLPGAMVGSGLVVARVQGDGAQRTLVALADSLPPDQFRVLRIWLRWRAKFSAASAPV